LLILTKFLLPLNLRIRRISCLFTPLAETLAPPMFRKTAPAAQVAPAALTPEHD